MNPQFPFPNPNPFPSSTFNPLNPNPNSSTFNPPVWNPNPQFNPHHHDLPSSLSSLQSLISLTNSALQSLFSLYPSLSSPPSPSLIQCPSNPDHKIPPSSLFNHSLHCPTPISLLQPLNYPNTLISHHPNNSISNFALPSSDLCFSLLDYVHFDSNFFYNHCPAAVTSSPNHTPHNTTFSIPPSLCIECANFATDAVNKKFGVRVLPSEIWAVGCEVEKWTDYPVEYSYSVFRVFLNVGFVNECDVSMWVLANSQRFGVAVDVAMRDHMLVLFRLCFKAMVREAVGFYESDGGCRLNRNSSTFKCPFLVQVLKWLSLQLSILYGETNAKLFAIDAVKHVLRTAAANASLFPLETKTVHSLGNEQGTDVNGDMGTPEKLLSKPIFVYQIAAAIAALHERSLVEERIKALRNPMHLTPSQRNAEHAYFSKKADEERQKRPNYRAIIEHDGLPSHRHDGRDTNKAKTREELLAEERDYKRRRRSYRGAKLKRNTKEVMRDIIEEYMDEIKQAGGIGCFEKADGGVISTFETSSAHDIRNLKPNLNLATDQQDGHKELHNASNIRGARPVVASYRKSEQQKTDRYSHSHFEDRGTNRWGRHEREYHSRSPSRDGKHGWSRENRRKSGVTEVNEVDNYKNYHSSDSQRSKRYDHKLFHSGREDSRKLEYPDRHRRQRSEDDKLDFYGRGELSDRYDPSEASDFYDDKFDDSKYVKPESYHERR